MRYSKRIAVGVVLSYLVPVVSGFCCCVGMFATPSSTGRDHDHSATQTVNHCHEQQNNSGKTDSSHSHAECNHPEILADLASSSNLGVTPNVPFSVSISDALPTAIGGPHHVASFTLETGPPLPQYLSPFSRLEILRI